MFIYRLLKDKLRHQETVGKNLMNWVVTSLEVAPTGCFVFYSEESTLWGWGEGSVGRVVVQG